MSKKLIVSEKPSYIPRIMGKMFINGEFVDAISGEVFEVINPATEEVIAHVPKGEREDVRRAIDAAEDAFRTSWWSSLYKSRERGRILWRFKDLVKQHEEELVTLLTMEQGKIIRESLSEIRSLQNTFEFYAGFGGKIKGEIVYVEDGDSLLEVKTIKKPMGICGAILPFNFPVSLFAWKVAPALIAGNAVIVKPSSTTPLTDIRLVHLLHKAGVPKGIINIVTGPASTVGEELVENPRVRRIAFTGSTETGKRIMQLAAKSVKKVTLELGGSDPTIVCDDADLDAAAEAVAFGRFRNCGQSCTSIKRVFVFEKVFASFMRKLLDHVRKIRVGNGLDPRTDMGPLNSLSQCQLVEHFVEDAVKRGAKVLVGGGRPPQFKRGFFYEPTVITEVDNSAKILTEECFGPALPVVAVSNLDEAIEKANSIRYGLGAGLWTRSEAVRQRVERDVQAGILWVNYKPLSVPETPFGGVKESGVGRELGYEGLEEYLETVSVRVFHGQWNMTKPGERGC